jgi:hypothetical protein
MMLKRKRLILFALVIAIAALFVATKAIAQSPYDCPAPDSCESGPYTLTAVRGGSGEFPVKTTCYDSEGDPFTCYKYEYALSEGDVNKIDHVYFGIPYNCFDPITVFEVVYWPTTSDYIHVDYYDPCAGATNVSFGDYVCNVRVVSIAPQGNKAVFFADTARNGSGSQYISAGNKKYGCLTPIVAPGYNFERPLGASSAGSECITIDANSEYPISMSLTRDPITGYALELTVKFHKSLDCSGTAYDPTISTPEPLVYCTGGTGSKLNECIKLTAESPGCVNYYIGAKLCTWCY